MNNRLLLSTLSSDTLILTASDRLARELRILYAQEKVRKNQITWEAPNIISFNTLTEELWDKTWPGEQKIMPAHVYYVFRSIIENSEEGSQLISGHYMAKTAVHAKHLIQQYMINLNDADKNDHNLETLAFMKWDNEFNVYARESNVITGNEIIKWCVDNVTTIIDYVPDNILAIGFSKITPLEESFLEGLEKSGKKIKFIKSDDLDINKKTISFSEYESPIIELYKVATKIKDDLLPYRENQESAPKIALVVPNLEQQRDMIASVLDNILCPFTLLPGNGDEPKPWRFSKGFPLINHELINTACSVLNISRTGNQLKDISAYLLSARLCKDKDEAIHNARLDYKIHQYGSLYISLNDLSAIAEKVSPSLYIKLSKLDAELKENNNSTTPSMWKHRFISRLRIADWPGRENFNSEYFQAYNAFLDQLDAFGNLDLVLGEINLGQAMRLFNEMLKTQLFQSREDYYPPVQIMSIDDLEGHNFDKIYVVNMTAETLPRKPEPNPLIPHSLQKTAGVAGCTAELQHKEAMNIKNILYAVSDHIHISYAKLTEEGRLQSPSQLFSELTIIKNNVVDGYTQNERHALEQTIEHIPPVSDVELDTMITDCVDRKLKGGIKILSNQARGGFYSLCQSRLHVNEFPEPTDGLSYAEQGELVHETLKHIWSKLQNSNNLKVKSYDEIRNIVINAVDDAFSNENAPYLLKIDMYRNLEKERLISLCLQWLEFEKQRADEFDVIALEQEFIAMIDNISIPIRIDRIDRIYTDDGPKTIIIDYKTGATASTTGWDPDTLIEPQLPIYGSCADFSEIGFNVPDGIAIFKVIDAGCNILLWSNFTSNLHTKNYKKNIGDWSLLNDEWRNAASRNALAFLNGDGHINITQMDKYNFTHGYLYDLLDEEIKI